MQSPFWSWEISRVTRLATAGLFLLLCHREARTMYDSTGQFHSDPRIAHITERMVHVLRQHEVPPTTFARPSLPKGAAASPLVDVSICPEKEIVTELGEVLRLRCDEPYVDLVAVFSNVQEATAYLVGHGALVLDTFGTRIFFSYPLSRLEELGHCPYLRTHVDTWRRDTVHSNLSVPEEKSARISCSQLWCRGFSTVGPV